MTDEEADQIRRQLGEKEGIFVGYSAAANVAATVKLLRRIKREVNLVTILCDTRYIENHFLETILKIFCIQISV